MPSHDLNQQLRKLAEEWGADFFGIADLTAAQAEIRRWGGDDLAAFPRAVSVGIEMFHSIVDRLPRREERAVAAAYRHHCYEYLSQRLDGVTSRLASAIQQAGFHAMPIAAAQKVDDSKIAGPISHKLPAHLAGLGWIGKSCLLVTPEAGPRARFATVLTAAPLTPTGSPMEERCLTCTVCSDACPSGAIKGHPFRADEPREARLDAVRCSEVHAAGRAHSPWWVCGMCLYSCPWGRRRSAALAGPTHR